MPMFPIYSQKVIFNMRARGMLMTTKNPFFFSSLDLAYLKWYSF